MSSGLIGHEALQKEFQGLADRRELAHGYLLVGPPRVGKRLFALALARYLEHGTFSPDAEDSPILGDALVVEPDEAGSIGIDRVREVRNFLWQLPNRSPYRTLVVNDAEFLTDEAQNAFLKVAEEPSSRALILLVLDDPEKLRPTLQSRFQKIFFTEVPAEPLRAWIRRELKLPAGKAEEIAKLSYGQPGLAARLVGDEAFQERLKLAKQMLKGGDALRRETIRKLVDDETFDLAAFLETLLIAAAHAGIKDPKLWHAALELRRQASYFNLNPRLQLTALGRLFSK